MKFEIVTVGSVGTPGLGAALDEYVDRIGRYLQVDVRNVSAGSAGDEGERKRQEAENLAAAAHEDGVWIALDASGRSLGSRKLADWIGDQMVGGVRYLSFFIGGAYGLDPTFRRQECDWTLSLSSLTLPHELAAVVLAEQLYRAMTIVRGEPYHK